MEFMASTAVVVAAGGIGYALHRFMNREMYHNAPSQEELRGFTDSANNRDFHNTFGIRPE